MINYTKNFTKSQPLVLISALALALSFINLNRPQLNLCFRVYLLRPPPLEQKFLNHQGLQ